MNIPASRKQRKTAMQIQRALRKDPNDIRSLLQLAAILGTTRPDLDQKRRVLHQVLTLEPSNRPAREMLFDMDRAEIGGDSTRLSLAVILTDPSPALPEPPLVLKYSIVHQLLVYLFIGFTVLIGLINLGEAESLVRWGVFLALLIVPLWYVSSIIELGDSGLRVSRLFGLVRAEVAWSDVREIKRAALGRGIKIINRAGKAVQVSEQVQGYPFILDILAQTRPDLFPRAENPGNGTQNASVATPWVVKTVNKM